MNRSQLDWDKFYLRLAREASFMSKDPSTKCGAVIVRPDKTICSLGFNGFPPGCDDSEELYANRELKYERIVHAEVNAISNAQGERLDGYTIYTWPPGWGPSCARCTTSILSARLKRVVHIRDHSDFASRWKDSSERGLQMYKEAGVEVVGLEGLKIDL